MNTTIELETEVLPLVATRNMVVLPGVMIPIHVARESTKRIVRLLEKNPDQKFAIVCQRSAEVENPTMDDLMDYGVIAQYNQTMEFPGQDNSISILVTAVERCKLIDVVSERPYLKASVVTVPELELDVKDMETHVGLDALRHTMREFTRKNEDLPQEAAIAFDNIEYNENCINFLCTNLPISIADRETLIKHDTLKGRLLELISIINRELQLLDLKLKIQDQTRQALDNEQRQYFLRQQMTSIRKELGGENAPVDVQRLMNLASEKKWSEETRTMFEEELHKLEAMQPHSPDYQMQVNYLQQVVKLPWGEYTTDNLSLKNAERTLNQDHYGMEKVKERILEYISVISLRGQLSSPILCLYGPPGVGKTSLGKSIAAALKRKYVRVSLGGVHDESEVRGHRRTYIGAMPGRIIKALEKAGSSNPVFVLDEIDKLGRQSNHGDPSSALLEVLDPEQNSAFHDNYIDMDYDLSKVLFVATANDIAGIPEPLRDRMEMIEVSGYITEEKIEIAKRHLIPKRIRENGLEHYNLKFRKDAIEMLIERYTRESGVRQLEKQIDKLLRKIAYKVALVGIPPFVSITKEAVEELLGNPPFYRDIYQGNSHAGVVTGLAWTSVGGEILFIETSVSKGKAGSLTITGNLGDVMKESATIAMEYVKAHADVLGIDYRVFAKWNVHIHVPEGATPKDGPSAGITIATSIASAFTQRKVRKNVAMTGEITLRGKVLPVGGIKEKILAAKRAGITDIMLCSANEKDILEIPEVYRKGITFHYVETVKDVWDFALTDEKVKDAIKIENYEEK